MMLSGFIYEIQGMPWLLQLVTMIVPARYYVSALQTIYTAGDIWPALLQNMLGMLAVGGVFFVITVAKSSRRLD